MNNYKGVHKRKQGRFMLSPLFTYLLIAVTILIAARLTYSISWPLRQMIQKNRESDQLETNIQDMKLKNQELQKESASLRTDAGMELEARKMGYIKKGEVMLYIPSRKVQSSPNGLGSE